MLWQAWRERASIRIRVSQQALMLHFSLTHRPYYGQPFFSEQAFIVIISPLKCRLRTLPLVNDHLRYFVDYYRAHFEEWRCSSIDGNIHIWKADTKLREWSASYRSQKLITSCIQFENYLNGNAPESGSQPTTRIPSRHYVVKSLRLIVDFEYLINANRALVIL